MSSNIESIKFNDGLVATDSINHQSYLCGVAQLWDVYSPIFYEIYKGFNRQFIPYLFSCDLKGIIPIAVG